MMMNKYLAIFLAASLATLGIGCASETQTQSPSQLNRLGLTDPIEVVLSGYGPPTSSFSQGLTHIGNRLEAAFGEAVEVHYVYNILDLGYANASAQIELVENNALTLGYVTMSTGIPALELAALPFLFSDNDSVRAAMDGALGQAAVESIEANSNLRILGFYENGFRHISNSVRPVHVPADLKDIKIRVLAIQERPFQLMGAAPEVTPLPAVVPGLASGELEGQENPFENVATYGMYHHQKYYTKTYHSYMSRPIFVNRTTFDAWPLSFQREFRAAVREAISLQRSLHDQAEIDSEVIIKESGGEVVELTAQQRQQFVDAVTPIYEEARSTYSAELLEHIGL
jgi:TRAP-type transport system periplasmic protein